MTPASSTTPVSPDETQRWVDRALTRRPHRFVDFVEALPGVSPLEALNELMAHDDRAEPHLEMLIRDAARMPARYEACEQPSSLPLPHPLDAEWRFTHDSAANLVERVADATKPGDNILLLGTPTVSLAAHASNADRRFTMVGEGNVVCAALDQVTQADRRFNRRQSSGFRACVVDPPWYLAAYQDMLRDASRLTAIGAMIFVSIPQIGTRPGAREDREEIVCLAAEAGLACIDQQEGGLRYRTPLFETAAFEAAGIHARMSSWRRGDLLLFRKVRNVPLPVRRGGVPSLELTIDGIRLRLLAERSTGTALRPIAATEVFPSISSRAYDRHRANLWTSTNRALAVDPIVAAIALVSQSAGANVVLGGTWPEADVDAVRRLSEEITDLIGRETADAVRLVGGTSWLRNMTDVRLLNGSAAAFLRRVRGIDA